jgi:putative DNA primase/helicase
MSDVVELGPTLAPEELEAELTRLAALSSVEYERQRQAAAAYTKLRLHILDQLVKERRVSTSDDQAKFVRDRELSITPVDGSSILDNVVKDLTKYVCLSDEAASAVALWVMHTYCLGASFTSPRLAITSPEPRCGKTTLINWLSTVVERPLNSVNVSPAVVFHVVDQKKPTLLIDEADTFLANNNELRGILNSGHQRNGNVLRWDGRARCLREYATFSACAISMIGTLPTTLRDRSIRVRLRRRQSGEDISPLRLDRVSHRFANECARWAFDHQGHLPDPVMPAQLINRDADNWRPLLAIADRVGGMWPDKARAVAISMIEDEDVSPGVRLLADIREIFDGHDWMSSAALAKALDEAGTVLSQKELANKLRAYEIRPKKTRSGQPGRKGKPDRGYRREWFADAFARYLPNGTTGTSGTNDVPDVPDDDG